MGCNLRDCGDLAMNVGNQYPVPSTRPILRLAPFFVFAAAFGLYTATAAPATLFGDPSEYQFIPAILGIAHPPGYAFYTLLAKLWQTVVPVGTIAFRTNLLAAAVGAWVVTAVYLIVHELQQAAPDSRFAVHASFLPPLFAASSLELSLEAYPSSFPPPCSDTNRSQANILPPHPVRGKSLSIVRSPVATPSSPPVTARL